MLNQQLFKLVRCNYAITIQIKAVKYIFKFQNFLASKKLRSNI